MKKPDYEGLKGATMMKSLIKIFFGRFRNFEALRLLAERCMVNAIGT